jgi:hypothetical protein
VTLDLPKSALALLSTLATRGATTIQNRCINQSDVDRLVAAELVERERGGGWAPTEAGRARLLRELAANGEIDPFRAQHLSVTRGRVETPDGPVDVTIDEAESPLCWLARRKGRDGKPLIEPVQFQAGERLRADFTRANLTPNVTSSWDASRAQGRRGQSAGATFTDAVVAAREQVNRAVEAVGPEFAGVLLDVCCFLKGLEDVERERRWPPRSAKIVLQLGLDRLARHYGLAQEARARARAPIRTWLDADSGSVVGS